MAKTALKQKVGLLILGMFFSLVLIEIALQVSGMIFILSQKYKNSITNQVVYDGKTYRILTLGESTTANLLDGHGSWPDELEKILNKNSVKFKVFNRALPGSNTAFILAQLRNNLEKYDPDMVITMMGVNDEGIDLIYDQKTSYNIRNLQIYKLIEWLNEALTFTEVDRLDHKVPNIDKVNILITKGRTHLDNNELDSAKSAFNEAINLSREHDSVYVKIAHIYNHRGFKEEAIDLFNKLIEINPRNHESYLFFGSNYLAEEEYEKAKINLEQAVKLNPKLMQEGF